MRERVRVHAPVDHERGRGGGKRGGNGEPAREAGEDEPHSNHRRGQSRVGDERAGRGEARRQQHSGEGNPPVGSLAKRRIARQLRPCPGGGLRSLSDGLRCRLLQDRGRARSGGGLSRRVSAEGGGHDPRGARGGSRGAAARVQRRREVGGDARLDGWPLRDPCDRPGTPSLSAFCLLDNGSPDDLGARGFDRPISERYCAWGRA
jgi:hypothetical protein